ncbi:hypothetical protein L1987_32404 [Smallanthus sonchifolius]|uniref:Uncharacterized protein n=1 Tax=Smallanthus sonchifolius TaxID=185202 RepID=A0ACB9HNT4_9ASTR|nr:hypothetical protein L1987_32404 [Smallanthus sonchifolius]
MPLATSPSGAVGSLLRSVDGSLPHGRQIGQMPQKEKEWNRISVIRSVLKAKDACVRNLPQCSVITSAKASAHSKLLKLKRNTYSTKQARHFLSADLWAFDYQGIETLQIKPGDWHSIAVILYVYGYNYLRSQCAYDVAPGGLLASVYHLTRIEYGVDQPEEDTKLIQLLPWCGIPELSILIPYKNILTFFFLLSTTFASIKLPSLRSPISQKQARTKAFPDHELWSNLNPFRIRTRHPLL